MYEEYLMSKRVRKIVEMAMTDTEILELTSYDNREDHKDAIVHDIMSGLEDIVGSQSTLQLLTIAYKLLKSDLVEEFIKED